MATAAQIEANRRNAQKSTGPKTPEGKDRSRRNSLKHGLAGRELLPEQHPDASRARVGRLTSVLNPRSGREAWLLELLAIDTLRLERCILEEQALRAQAARQAELSWDVDRALDAEELGRKLAGRPAEVRLRLERTRHGCLWLAARWGEVLAGLLAGGPADDAAARALDLLGVPPEGRSAATAPPDLAEAARAEIERLSIRAESLAEIDAAGRELAECGLGPEVEKALRRVRRYEAACFRRIEWTQKALRDGSLSVNPPTDDQPRPEPASRPEPVPARASAGPNEPKPPTAPARIEANPPRPADRPLQFSASPAAPGLADALRSTLLAPPSGNRRARRAARRAG